MLIQNRLAAVDLGSNSFHLSVVQYEGDRELKAIEKKGVKVQLAAGMKDAQLSDEAIQRGLRCLRKFAKRMSELSVSSVRIVGTSALRSALNSDKFTLPAKEILGYPIEIISGEEEARLIYSGVASAYARMSCDQSDKRLVVDIGGGSTEIVVGSQEKCLLANSLAMGCVVFRESFFRGGEINEACLEEAYQHARQLIASVKEQYQQVGWQQVIGTSGTMQAVAQVLRAQGWTESGITRPALLKLKDKLLCFETLEAVRFDGLSEKRRSVFASGLVIVLALFDELEFEHISICKAALREGVLHELMLQRMAESAS